MKINKIKFLTTGAVLGTSLVGTLFAVSAKISNNTSNEAQTNNAEASQYLKNRLTDYAETQADSYKKLINDLDIPKELKDAFVNKVNSMEYSPEKYNDSTIKDIYEELKNNQEKYKKLFNEVNEVNKNPLVSNKYAGNTDELETKNNEALTALQKFGTDAELAKNIIDQLNKKDANDNVESANDKYKEFVNEFTPISKNKYKQMMKMGNIAYPALHDFLDYVDKTTTLDEVKKAWETFEKLNNKVQELRNESNLFRNDVMPLLVEKRIRDENLVKANQVLSKTDNKNYTLTLPENFKFDGSDESQVNFVFSVVDQDINDLKVAASELMKLLINTLNIPQELKDAYKKKAESENKDIALLKDIYKALKENEDKYTKLYDNINSLNPLVIDQYAGVTDELKSEYEPIYNKLTSLGKNSELADNLIDEIRNKTIKASEQAYEKYKEFINKFTPISKEKYKEMMRNGNIGDPALRKFLDYVSDDATTLDEVKKAWETFEKLNNKVQELKDKNDKYNKELKPYVIEEGITGEDVDKANEITSKTDNKQYETDLPENFKFDGSDESQLNPIKEAIDQDKSSLDDASKSIWKKLINKLNIPQELKNAFIEKISELDSDKLKDLYENIRENQAKYSRLFNKLNNGGYELNLNDYPRARDEDVASYKNSLKQLQDLGKGSDLAKNMINGILSEEKEDDVDQKDNKFEVDKENVKTRKKDNISKILVATLTTISLFVVLITSAVILLFKKK